MDKAQRGPHCRSIISLGSQPRDKRVGHSRSCWEPVGQLQVQLWQACEWPGAAGEGAARGTHIKGTQDVECGPNAQVVDGAQDECHDEGADAVALGEQGRDGEADEDPEKQRDERGVQCSWDRGAGLSMARSSPPLFNRPPKTTPSWKPSLLSSWSPSFRDPITPASLSLRQETVSSCCPISGLWSVCVHMRVLSPEVKEPVCPTGPHLCLPMMGCGAQKAMQ